MLVRFRRDACVERVVRFVVALTVAEAARDADRAAQIYRIALDRHRGVRNFEPALVAAYANFLVSINALSQARDELALARAEDAVVRAEEELPLMTRLIAEPVMLTEAESQATSQEVSDAAKGGAAAGSRGEGRSGRGLAARPLPQRTPCSVNAAP